MVINHGGENSGQRCNILDTHPSRKKDWYPKRNAKVSVSIQKSSTQELLAPVKPIFSKSVYLLPIREVSFDGLPKWVQETVFDILLSDHFDRIDHLGPADLQSIFQYILGQTALVKTLYIDRPAVEVSMPDIRLKSIVTVKEIVNCFA